VGTSGIFLYTKKEIATNSKIPYAANHEQNGEDTINGYLQDFGLSEKEARIFFMLSKKGSATTAEISSMTQLSRLQTYRIIKALLDKGLVEMALERPRRFTPLKIEQALTLLGQEAERRVADLERKTPLLLREWSTASDMRNDDTNFAFRIIQGAKNVTKFRNMLCEAAKKEISVVIKPNELTKMTLDGGDDVFERLANNNNVSVRGLSEVNRFNIDASKRFLEFSKLNHIMNSHIVPFTLIDQQEAFICLSKDGKDGIPENAIWTNHPEIAKMLRDFFEMLWKSSTDGDSRLHEIENTQKAN
jgi:sugar-specific transcriptional regulator TrmB